MAKVKLEKASSSKAGTHDIKRKATAARNAAKKPVKKTTAKSKAIKDDEENPKGLSSPSTAQAMAPQSNKKSSSSKLPPATPRKKSDDDNVEFLRARIKELEGDLQKFFYQSRKSN